MLKKFNDLSEQIIYIGDIGEKSDTIICITVRVQYEQICTVSELTFEIFQLDGNTNIIEAHVGEMCCSLRCDLTFQKKQVLKIDNIGIFPEYQNKGYGSLLMSTMIGYIKDFKLDTIKGIIYWHDVENAQLEKRLLHFYHKFGFEIDSDKIMKNLR